MSAFEPTAYLDERYSDPNATPETWATALETLETAPIFWLSTVTPAGEPHVTPLIVVWHDEALWFCTGLAEQKGRNLTTNPHCVMTTGNKAYDTGFDVTVRGAAERVADDAALRSVAELYVQKYGEDWRFEVANGFFRHGEHDAAVFRVKPQVVHGFRRGPIASQTRWTCQDADPSGA